MKKRIFSIFAYAAMAMFSVAPQVVNAQFGTTTSTGVVTGSAITGQCTGAASQSINCGLNSVQGYFPGTRFQSVLQFLAFVINILLVLAGAVAVLFIVIGGFQYIMSAGNAETATKGKKAVINAVIGIIIIILSYMVINVVVGTLTSTSTFLFS